MSPGSRRLVSRLMARPDFACCLAVRVQPQGRHDDRSIRCSRSPSRASRRPSDTSCQPARARENDGIAHQQRRVAVRLELASFEALLSRDRTLAARMQQMMVRVINMAPLICSPGAGPRGGTAELRSRPSNCCVIRLSARCGRVPKSSSVMAGSQSCRSFSLRSKYVNL